MSSILAVGTLAFDSIETPFGHVGKILGGSVNHFSLAASFFAPVFCVSVVGEDYPKDHLALLRKKGIDTDGVCIQPGKTFFWAGRYGDDLNDRETLDTQLNVFQNFEPRLPEKYRDARFVFLGNMAPPIQMKVLDQVRSPRFIAIDTMNYWIESQRDALISAISRCHCLIINEAEVRQLTRVHNIVKAAEIVRSWGPATLVIKRGEYGAVLFHNGSMFGVPAFLLSEVKDPTGAGDTFAGGLVGHLAAQGDVTLDESLFRQAIVHGSVMASFNIQDFGSQYLMKIRNTDIRERYQQFVRLTSFDSSVN